MRVTTIYSALLAGALVLTGCGGDSETETPKAGSKSSAEEKKSDVKVGLAYDVGGRGDQSFNDAAAAGLDKAKAEFGIEAQEAEAGQGEPEAAREERLRALAASGFNPVIAVGFAYGPAVAKVAKDTPDVNFAIVDDASAVGPNVANLLFAEHEGSFLVGVAAALKSTSGNVGFIGGVDVPLIHKFQAGYEAGAKAAKPDIKVQTTYLTQAPDFSGFGDPAKGKTAAEGMYDAGADVVYHAAGGSGGGVFQAAAAADKMAIGVDSDQYNTADPALKEVIITSMLKKVDVAVYDFIKTVVDGNFTAGSTVYNLEKDGVGYSTTGGKIDDIVPQLEEYKAKIVSGEITVPEK